MGAIKVHEFIAVDGVFEDPSWTFEFGFDPRMGEAIGAIVGSCRALLLGRRTFDDDPGAPFFNDSPKYVVSGSPLAAEWGNSRLLGPYRADVIRDLKASIDGDLYVSGSGTLVRALLADGLVDELHLFTYPVARGAGQRLLPGGGPATTFTLAGSDAYSNGVVHLAYVPLAAGAS
jgi:dihydrofolate reductase